MECSLASNGCRRVWTLCQRSVARTKPVRHVQRRQLATEVRRDNLPPAPDDSYANRGLKKPRVRNPLLDQIRIVPASPSYFSATPQFTDDFLELTLLLRKYQHLPQGPEPNEATWLLFDQYTTRINEKVKPGRYRTMLEMMKRLNNIHLPLMPEEVDLALQKYKRIVQQKVNKQKEIKIDRYGRTRGLGRRKSSSAECWVIEGEGEILVNGRTFTDYFGRLHDRESAIWALKVTNRSDKYNVWIRTAGGGTTGQAEAIQLGIAKALAAQEPALLPLLKEAGVLVRDPRSVERKKPGKLKARKMPAWVKR